METEVNSRKDVGNVNDFLVKWCQERLGDKSSTGIQEELHLRYFLIYFLHELNDEVDQLVLQHSFCMEVRDQERDVVSLDWFPPQDEEGFCSLRQESGKLVDQDVLNFICLLNSDADAHTVYAGLNQDLFILIPRNCEGVEEQFWGALSLDFRDIMPFGGLRGEVRDCKSSGKRGPNALKVRAQ